MIQCNKKIKRNFFNLFSILTCDNCENEFIYDFIYIGNHTINLYILNSECINIIKKQKLTILFLKDAIINYNDIYFIIEKNEYYKLFDYLPAFIEDNNLFVLVYNEKNNIK